jgi:hypothetical protein
MKIDRRKALALAAGLSLAPWLAQAADRRYAALSLLADQFDVVFAREQVGSNLDRNQRQSFDAGASAFDRYALQAVQSALQRSQQGTQFTMLTLPTTSRLFKEPDRIFGSRVVALPGPVVDALIAAKATHLNLLTKVRGEARVPLVDRTTGMGNVRGLGFYVDEALRVIRQDTGEYSTGVLAPFVYLRLSLIDVESGEIVREQLIRAMRAYTTAGRADVTQAWQVLSAEEKVDALKQLLEDELAHAVPALIEPG